MSGDHRTPYLFVSYASVDRERVLSVVERLEAAGVNTWVDREGIHGGANYALEIAEAIEHAAALLLFCSAASLASRNVKQELARAYAQLGKSQMTKEALTRPRWYNQATEHHTLAAATFLFGTRPIGAALLRRTRYRATPPHRYRGHGCGPESRRSECTGQPVELAALPVLQLQGDWNRALTAAESE